MIDGMMILNQGCVTGHPADFGCREQEMNKVMDSVWGN